MAVDINCVAARRILTDRFRVTCDVTRAAADGVMISRVGKTYK
jgi:hypothetical protein